MPKPVGSKRKRPSAEKLVENAKITEDIRKRYAPQLRMLGKELIATGDLLVQLEEEMHKEAVKLTGDEQFYLDNTVSFEEFGGSMGEQIDYCDEISGPGFEDVCNLGESLVEVAATYISE